MDCDVGILYRDMPDGSMEIEASMLATGIGASTKRWEIEKVELGVDGEKIKPSESDDFYTAETYTPSTNVLVATVVFTAIGTQYTRYADQAQGGGICPVTGEATGASGSREKIGGIESGIDKVGMAAGLGLLASQAAKGSIKGRTVTFKLDKDAAEKVRNGDAKLEIQAKNTRKPQWEKIELPLGK